MSILKAYSLEAGVTPERKCRAPANRTLDGPSNLHRVRRVRRGVPCPDPRGARLRPSTTLGPVLSSSCDLDECRAEADLGLCTRHRPLLHRFSGRLEHAPHALPVRGDFGPTSGRQEDLLSRVPRGGPGGVRAGAGAAEVRLLVCPCTRGDITCIRGMPGAQPSSPEEVVDDRVGVEVALRGQRNAPPAVLPDHPALPAGLPAERSWVRPPVLPAEDASLRVEEVTPHRPGSARTRFSSIPASSVSRSSFPFAYPAPQ